MKKSELKSIIKECVKEILFEEGILSNIVAEVAFGINKAQGQLLEHESKLVNKDISLKQANLEKEEKEQKRKKLLETKKKMLNAVGGGEKMQKVFEGTSPLRESSSTHPSSPLSGVDPTDAGVDISNLFSLAGHKWQNLK